MRILFDHQVFSLQNAGGITTYFVELLKYLRSDASVDASALLGFSDTRSGIDSLRGKQTRVVHWGPRPVHSGMATYALNELLLNPYALINDRADVYHSTLYRFMPGVRARRRVLTHHDCVHERFPQLFPDTRRIVRTKQRGFAQADLILCVSESSRHDLLHFYGVDPQKTQVIYNGFSRPQRSPSGADELRRIVRQKPFLLYVGLRASYKNFDGLLHAFARTGLAARFDLLVLGGGEFTAAERALVGQLGLAEAVIAVPYASAGLLAEAYAQAALFVYPSLYEGFGIPPLESMAMETPVLVARNPATEEVCLDAAIFFDPANTEDFDLRLTLAVEDETLRREKVEAGLRLLPRYDWATTTERTLQMYRSLL